MEELMKGAMITMEKASNREAGSVGSSRIRGRWLWEAWDELEEMQMGRKYDFMIFQKAYWFEMAREFDGIKILDICDPDWLDHDNIFNFMKLMDGIVTSTPEIAEYIKQQLPERIVIKHIPDRIKMEEHQNVKVGHQKTLSKVGWFGYSRNYTYVSAGIDTLLKEGIEVHLHMDSEIKKSGVVYHKYDYKTLHDDIIRYDAMLMEVDRDKHDLRGRYKSPNKLITCYALGIPVIQTIKDLERLKTQEAREKEAAEKLEYVKNEWDIKKSVTEWKALIKQLSK
jgi:hypothetical protein